MGRNSPWVHDESSHLVPLEKGLQEVGWKRSDC